MAFFTLSRGTYTGRSGGGRCNRCLRRQCANPDVTDTRCLSHIFGAAEHRCQSRADHSCAGTSQVIKARSHLCCVLLHESGRNGTLSSVIKVAFIGAGSIEFTRNVATDLCGFAELGEELEL